MHGGCSSARHLSMRSSCERSSSRSAHATWALQPHRPPVHSFCLSTAGGDSEPAAKKQKQEEGDMMMTPNMGMAMQGQMGMGGGMGGPMGGGMPGMPGNMAMMRGPMGGGMGFPMGGGMQGNMGMMAGPPG